MARTKTERHESYELAKLKPYEHNPKIHTQEQIEHIASSIQQFGWQQPIVVDENDEIIIGHGRYAAARQVLGLEHAPVWVTTGLEESKKHALRVADNKLNMDTAFDLQKLEFVMEQVTADAVDISALGLDFDFAKLEPAEREQDEDDTADKLDTFNNNAVKQIVLMFDTETYETVLSDLHGIMSERPELHTNTDVFLYLLRGHLNGRASEAAAA